MALMYNPFTGTFDNTGTGMPVDGSGNYVLGSGSGQASALLTLNSTSKGFLLPRMTQAQRTAIPSPAQGLNVYQTDGGTGEGDWVYRADAWWQTLVINSSGVTPGAITVSDNLTVNNTGNGTGVLNLGSSGNAIVVPGNDFTISKTGVDRLKLFMSSGNLVLQNSGTSSDKGAGLQVKHSITAADYFANGTRLAQGVSIAPTLVAAANGDALIGMDIQPSFTTGAYTGVLQETLVLRGQPALVRFKNPTGTTAWGHISADSSNLDLVATGAFRLTVSGTQAMQVFTSRNLALQNGGTFTDVASAILQLNSTNQGLLIPRMNQAQRTAISSPAQGLQVYQTDGGTAEGGWVYRAGAWYQQLVVDSSGALTISGNLTAKTYTLTQPTAISASATTSIDLSTGDVFQINLVANISVLTLSNPHVGSCLLKFTQDATGSRTVSFPVGWKWPGNLVPVVTVTAGKTDIVSLVYDGSTYYASIVQNF